MAPPGDEFNIVLYIRALVTDPPVVYLYPRPTTPFPYQGAAATELPINVTSIGFYQAVALRRNTD